MQIQFSNQSATGSHYYSATYPRRTLQSQQRVQPSSSSLSYQLLQHPMIVQSRSTDSQLDVESSNLYSTMKYRNNADGNQKSCNVMVPSFFNRTHPSLLSESSESSSSSSSISIQQSKENIDCRNSEAASTKATTTAANHKMMTVANQRRRRSQDIFSRTAPSPIARDESDDNDTDDDDDDRNIAKRSKCDVEIYDTHANGLWIQRSYAFEEEEDDDCDDLHLEENVEVTVNMPINHHHSWSTDPRIR